MGLCEKLRKFRSQTPHFLFKRLAVIFLFLNTNIASRSENVILLCNVLCSDNSTEALFIFECSINEGIISVGNFLDVFIRQLTQLPRNHSAEVPCVDEQRFAFLLLVLCKEPERYRDLRRVE